MAITTVTTAGYLGILFQQQKRPNAFLKMAGSFAGQSIGDTFAYKAATSKEFPIGAFYQLPNPSQPANLEGANAPAATTQSISQATNVVQLFHETCSVTYLAESDKTISGVVPIPLGEANGEAQNPRSMEFQIRAKLQKIAQDANYSFLNGAYANPSDPSTTALKTRGIITAISTNYQDNSGDTASAVDDKAYRGYVDSLLSSLIQHNGYAIDETFVAFAGATEFLNLSHSYQKQGTIYLDPDLKVAGIQVRKILTGFGTLLLALDPDVPAQTVLVAKMDEVGIVGLEVPGKGVIFEEPLYKLGSADQTQIYGQMGIDHAPEYLHGVFKVPSGVAVAS
jgi:hypothetical protein